MEKLIEVQSGRLIKKTIEDNIQYLYNYDKNSGSFYFEAQIERLFLMLNIKIIKLEKPIENVKYLFELIYKKGNYKITNENILLFIE